MNSRLSVVSTTSSAGDKTPHPVVCPGVACFFPFQTAATTLVDLVIQSHMPHGKLWDMLSHTPNLRTLRLVHACGKQPPRLPMRPAPLSELHDGAIDLAHPVVFVKTARNRIVPVRGRGGEVDGVKLEEIFTILRLDELRADMHSTGSRALEVTAEMEAMVASGRNRDDPLLVAKGPLILTLLRKYCNQRTIRETLEQRLELLRQQSGERPRRLCPGAASWPPGDPHRF